MNKLFSLFLIGSIALVNVGCNEECDEWHEGDDCKSEVRTKYYGIYTGTFPGPGGLPKQVLVSEYPEDIQRLNIVVPYNNNMTLYLEYTPQSGSFTIPSQTIVYSEQVSSRFSGMGNFNGDELYFSLTIEDIFNGSVASSSTAIFTGSK